RQPGAGDLAAFLDGVAALFVEAVVKLQTSPGEGVTHAGGTPHGAVVALVDAGQHRDAAVTDVHQVLGQLHRRAVVVEADAGVRAFFVVYPDVDVGNVLLVEHGVDVRQVGLADQDQPVDAFLQQRVT